MKIFFLRVLVIWRRFRHGSTHHSEHHLHVASQAEALMNRANPFASWRERANWMIDIAEWVQREPKAQLRESGGVRRVRHQRIHVLLDWLDANRDSRRVVQTTLQKTLREAAGAELFFTTGLPREPGFFGEMSEKFLKLLLPKAPAQLDLSALFVAMFSGPADADWLLGLDQKTLSRIWKLCADDGIAHTFRQQMDEALVYLVTVILSVGISPPFRQRLERSNSLQATPFMTLRRELERYLHSGSQDEASLRSVRMLIAVCQAQTDKIYADLDENGVSVGMVYSIERMRAQLARMARLIDLRAALMHPGMGADQMQVLLGEMVAGHRQRSSLRGLIRRSFALLTRKMVERNAKYGQPRGEQYAARNRTEYRAMFQAAAIGGVIAVFTVFGQLALSSANVAHFFEGVFASLNYLVSLSVIAALGGAFAAKQPAVTAPALASRMGELGTHDGMEGLMSEVTVFLRAQAAAVFGNVMTLIPAMAAVSVGILLWSGMPVMHEDKAQASLDALSVFGCSPIFAAITGVFLWMASLMACFADNWFALRRLRESLTHHRRLVHALGAARAERWACWLERNLARMMGNICLAIFLGMTPVFARFFGLSLEIRHMTFALGTLVASVSSLGWPVFETSAFWLAASGIIVIGLLNVGVAFLCSLVVAMRTCGVPARTRRLVFKTILKRFFKRPHFFLLAGHQEIPALSAARTPPAESIEQKKRSKNSL
ncbi:MAG: preprotein translocase subunit TatB [Burkholderiaceae bacterium]